MSVDISPVFNSSEGIGGRVYPIDNAFVKLTIFWCKH